MGLFPSKDCAVMPPLSFGNFPGTYGNAAVCLEPKTYSAALVREVDEAISHWQIKSIADGTIHNTSTPCSYGEEGCDFAYKVMQELRPFGDSVPNTLWTSRLTYADDAERARLMEVLVGEGDGLFSGYNFARIDCTALGQFEVANLLSNGTEYASQLRADGFDVARLGISKFDAGFLGTQEILTFNSREQITDNVLRRTCTSLAVISVPESWAKEKGRVDDLYANAPEGYTPASVKSQAFYVSGDVVCDYLDGRYIEVTHIQTTDVGLVPKFLLPALARFGLFDQTYIDEAVKYVAYMRAALGRGAPYNKDDFC